MNAFRAMYILITLTCCFLEKVICQSISPQAFKTLNVANGLPQSFISGMVQDSTGFIWIGTRDGLARYDGRKFKIFRHIPGDTATLSDNIISSLHLDNEEQLWIYYEAGDVDILNTTTEALFHFTNDPVYKSLHALLNIDQSFAEDGKGNIWLLTLKGDLFVCNLSKRTLRLYSASELHLPSKKIENINSNNKDIVLVTENSLALFDDEQKLIKNLPYTFPDQRLQNINLARKFVPSICRKNGEIIVINEGRIIIYHPSTQSFSTLPLPANGKILNFCITQDNEGQIFFGYESNVYVLSPQNQLSLWKGKEESPVYGFKSMLFDKSGVLWLGGNGSGIRLYDLQLPRLAGLQYKTVFQDDILQNFLTVPLSEIKRTSLYDNPAYSIRWTKGVNNDIWFSNAGPATTNRANVYHYTKGHLIAPSWHYTDTVTLHHTQINGLALSPSGKLWGIDFFLRPVYFDTFTNAVTVYPPLDSADFNYSFTVSSLLIDKDEKFWISTALNGLFCYDKQNKKTMHYFANSTAGSIPTNQLMNIVQDPDSSHLLWIGSLGGGLIQFNKTTGKCRIYTTRDDLPNNTVYAVVADAKGVLWCSSNKGIFSFNRTTSKVRTFTSKDGLLGDEFNRYHFLQLPDGQIAFGGVEGYTVFNPIGIADDNFQPRIALTGIEINNTAADYGYPVSPFKQSINCISKIELLYDQNFLTFEFSALQFNITEKLQYRYMLEGVNENWINAGTSNIATYTNLPPKNYVFKVNSTNTSGRWSHYIKTISVVIKPPFWKTWWFSTLWILGGVILVYIIITSRIKAIKKQERKKMEFEQQASELKAQALRAQMNPHFVFNCLNSIKALIQEDKKNEAVNYLTTFSKLIRNQLNNADQEISLYDELETCKLYAHLEALRLGSKIECRFLVDDSVDTSSLKVPPLILQPFIENAIWHGVLPKTSGKISVKVSKNGEHIKCEIDDDGIGRKKAMQNKSQTFSTYESKGMQLVKNRLTLYNTINQKDVSVEVIDKTDTANNPAGTLVILKFKQEL